MKNRTNQILELLTTEKKAEVSFLAEKLGVSQVTIRKDLDALEHQGIILREHGSARLRSMDDINGRIAYHYEAKRKIAQQAAKLVANGDTIMIESGSCCALLAAALAASQRDLTIITNSAFIANYVRSCPAIQVILLGGIYQQEAQVVVGPMIRQTATNFCVDLFFLGTDGYSLRTGFTNRDQLRAQAVRDMAEQAEKIIILTESEKFSHRGVVPLKLQPEKCQVITDKQIPPESLAALQSQGIQTQTV